jgi:glyoxylase-like metal-dependent hydrolase (beta-lactamase superfamily II)
MGNIHVRVNGTGNAWPIPLGSEHPFYDKKNPDELANASFSIIKSGSQEISRESIEWEVLIDAGHGVVQYLIRHHNRLPEAIALTHSHLDHTLSLDWILQSHYKHFNKERKMPLYAGRPAWSFVEDSFPQVPALADFMELKPGISIPVAGIPELCITFYPVYHGDRVRGPGMLVFETDEVGEKSHKIIFTGDILCPLLRETDYRNLQNADMIFVDANNRFPFPGSNHWSITGDAPESSVESEFLKTFRKQISFNHLISSHLPDSGDPGIRAYFDEFLNNRIENIPLSVIDFVRLINPGKVLLVHYGGIEDLNYNRQDILNPVQLEEWARAQATKRKMGCEFIVPRPGDIILPGRV